MGVFFTLLFLLTVAVLLTYKSFPSLVDLCTTIWSAVSKNLNSSAGYGPAETVLRGTIYDRNGNELAVSYRIYSLEAHPARINDISRTATLLAPFANESAEKLAEKLKRARYPLELFDNLEEKQVEQIEALHLSGIFCKANEVRFYPGHTAASHMLGFMGNGVGLAGIEGKYDTILRGGLFDKSSIRDIDFAEANSLGAAGADLVLTLDIKLQRHLEQRFREHLAAQGTTRGVCLLLEPANGRILALVNQPSYNPNYFWKVQESHRVNRLYNHLLNKNLIRDILVRAAAIEREGLDGTGLLPETVAAPDYGFSPAEIAAFEQRIHLYAPVADNWQTGPEMKNQTGERSALTGVQVGVTLASLVNGGWRIHPYVVDSLYDHATKRRYLRDNSVTERIHVLDPVLGVKIRRELFSRWRDSRKDQIVFSVNSVQLARKENFSSYSMQEIFVGLAPALHPKYLLLMAVEQDQLFPWPVNTKKTRLSQLNVMGQEVLPFFIDEGKKDALPDTPPVRSRENLRQFFISKRLQFHEGPEKGEAPVMRMPQLRGISLRRGLQRLAPYRMRVKINGTGTIIAQYPLPDTALGESDECILTLDSK